MAGQMSFMPFQPAKAHITQNGTITLSASDGLGRFVVKTEAVPEAGSLVQFDLVILRRPDQPVANGNVRGTIFRPDGTTPVAGAYVALYTDGNLVGTKRSNADGTFDFGPVPVPTAAGTAVTIPLEAKWVTRGWRSEALVTENRFGRGVLATKNITDFSHPAWAVPAPAVALLLG